jgi:TPR repeat protein
MILPFLLAACGWMSPAEPPVVVAERASCDTPAACEAACDDGDALACNQLGLWLHDGLNGAEVDLEEAAARYARACELRAGIGCYNLAGQKAGGQGIPRDPEGARELVLEARAHYQASCDAGALAWCSNLAGLLQRGEGAPPSPEAALALYDETCEKGHDLSCLEVANMLLDGEGGARDPERAEALLRRSCERGFEPACNNLALQVEERGGDPLPIFRKACERGVPIACRNVASRLDDPEEALALLRVACDAPSDLDGVACAMSADLLLRREPQDVPQALSDLRRACSVGLTEACVEAVRVGAISGLLAPEEGRDLMERACGLGHQLACSVLDRSGEGREDPPWTDPPQ